MHSEKHQITSASFHWPGISRIRPHACIQYSLARFQSDYTTSLNAVFTDQTPVHPYHVPANSIARFQLDRATCLHAVFVSHTYVGPGQTPPVLAAQTSIGSHRMSAHSIHWPDCSRTITHACQKYVLARFQSDQTICLHVVLVSHTYVGPG